MPDDTSAPKLPSFPSPTTGNVSPAPTTSTPLSSPTQPVSNISPEPVLTPPMPLTSNDPNPSFPEDSQDGESLLAEDNQPGVNLLYSNEYNATTNPNDSYTSPYSTPKSPSFQEEAATPPLETTPVIDPAPEEPKFPVYNPPEPVVVDDPLDLTDPIAPEMAHPNFQSFSPPVSEPTPTTPPILDTQTPVLEMTPASVPTQGSSNGKFVALLLGLIAIGAIAAAVTIFLQLGKAQTNLNILKQTKDNQQTIPSETPSPTTSENPVLTMPPIQIAPSMAITITPAATPSASPTVNVTSAPQPTVAPTATPTKATSPVTNSMFIFDRFTAVLAKATEKVATAQLLMVTVENVDKAGAPTAKFWFRESETKKVYFYILSEGNGLLTLFDKQIYVTPDNNIPGLNADFKAGKLGIDLEETLKLAKSTVINNASLTGEPTSATAQFIKTTTGPGSSPVTLWQISYKYADRTSPVIVQINSQTKQVIYTNVKYNKPS